MRLQFSLTFSNIFLTALIVLFTWTSLAHGAVINRDLSLARRDPGGEARASGVEVSIDDILKRDGIVFATKPKGERESIVGRDSNGAGGSVDDRYTLAPRTTEENNEEAVVDGHGHLPKRWYTLVEIAETEESE